jgi:hypothetical protein
MVRVPGLSPGALSQVMGSNTYGSIYFSFQSHPISLGDCSGEVILNKRSKRFLNKKEAKAAKFQIPKEIGLG